MGLGSHPVSPNQNSTLILAHYKYCILHLLPSTQEDEAVEGKWGWEEGIISEDPFTEVSLRVILHTVK